jgi:molybdopterin converting factor small subunit
MPVRVRLIGDLRRFVDADVVEIEVEDGKCTVGAAFDEMVERYPRLRAQLLDDKGRLHYAMTMATGGRRISWPHDRDELIEDGGELMLTRFHSGG